MILKGDITKENKTTSLYEVEDTITFLLGENNFTSKGSYFLHFGKSLQYSNQIILNRSSFKIDDKEVEKKFPKISNLYFSSIFPLVLTHHEGNYRVAQYNEVAKRIMENDVAIRNNYSGDGLEYIRDQFMEKVKNQTEFQQFIEQLPLYQVLNISATPKFKKEQVNFQWNVAGLGVIEGIGDLKLDTVENKMNVTLKDTNDALIMELIENYITENGILMSFSENEFPEISFKMETIYKNDFNGIQKSTAELIILIGEKFKYKQNFYLSLSPINN